MVPTKSMVVLIPFEWQYTSPPYAWRPTSAICSESNCMRGQFGSLRGNITFLTFSSKNTLHEYGTLWLECGHLHSTTSWCNLPSKHQFCICNGLYQLHLQLVVRLSGKLSLDGDDQGHQLSMTSTCRTRDLLLCMTECVELLEQDGWHCNWF